ncbi:MAG: 2-oxoacid:acceptor oxidoreductase subunit alpha [Acidimicrobiia bacterium]
MTVQTRRRIDDLNVMVAGQGGGGARTHANHRGWGVGRRGVRVDTARDVASRIKGGHAAALMRGSVAARGCMGDELDLLVAFDEEAVQRGGQWLAADGIVIFDASGGPVPRGHLPPEATVYEIPFARLAVRDLRRDLFKNSLGFGIVTRILSVGDDEAADMLSQRFCHLRPEVAEANLGALRAGFAYADEHGLHADAGPWFLYDAPPSGRILISGNEAAALGFLVAGGRFFAGYPITPASEILSFLERRLPDFGGVAIQAEDELAAVNMAMGAAMTGARAMTATSGPGISLMQEGVSHLGSAEIPLVVVDCQRSGPSTGMPTKSEQSDINMVVHGGNGDFPRIVLAPATPTDCFDLAALATNLAQEIQGPVYLLLDQAVSQDSSTVEPFDLGSVEPTTGKRLSGEELADLPEYRRYLVTDDGVSPWAVPGTPGGMSLVTGNERNEWGHVATEPGNRVAMLDKRMRKIERVRDSLPAGHRWGDPEAVVGMIGIGMELGVMEEASERLAAAGLTVSGLQPRTLWPVLDETTEFVGAKERVYVVEHNAEGQLAHLVASVGAPHERLRPVLKYDGIPFRPQELADLVLGAEGTVG